MRAKTPNKSAPVKIDEFIICENALSSAVHSFISGARFSFRPNSFWVFCCAPHVSGRTIPHVRMNYQTLSISQDIYRPQIFLSTVSINLVSVAVVVGGRWWWWCCSAILFHYCQPAFHSRAEGNKVRWFLFLIEKISLISEMRD